MSPACHLNSDLTHRHSDRNGRQPVSSDPSPAFSGLVALESRSDQGRTWLEQQQKPDWKEYVVDMADQLNMGGLTLADSKHAGGYGPNTRSAYIPPHLRAGAGGPQMPPGPAGPMGVPGPPGMDGPRPMMNATMNGGPWGPPPPAPPSQRCVLAGSCRLTC